MRFGEGLRARAASRHHHKRQGRRCVRRILRYVAIAVTLPIITITTSVITVTIFITVIALCGTPCRSSSRLPATCASPSAACACLLVMCVESPALWGTHCQASKALHSGHGSQRASEYRVRQVSSPLSHITHAYTHPIITLFFFETSPCPSPPNPQKIDLSPCCVVMQYLLQADSTVTTSTVAGSTVLRACNATSHAMHTGFSMNA